MRSKERYTTAYSVQRTPDHSVAGYERAVDVDALGWRQAREDSRHGWVEAQDLVNDGVEMGKVLQLLIAWRGAVCVYVWLDLGSQARGVFWVPCHFVADVGQCCRSRIASTKSHKHFVYQEGGRNPDRHSPAS